jgi:hypothetical protein
MNQREISYRVRCLPRVVCLAAIELVKKSSSAPVKKTY